MAAAPCSEDAIVKSLATARISAFAATVLSDSLLSVGRTYSSDLSD